MRWRIALLVAGVLAIAGYAAYKALSPKPTFHGTMLSTPRPVPDFTLIDGDGRPRRFSAFRGKTLLVFFGYTRCPDVCPLTMQKLALAYRALGEPEDLQVVMISVDPETDTPERIQQYVTGFHPRFVGLTGTPEAIAQAASAFFIYYRARDQLVDHTATINLVDPQGRLRVVYNEANLAPQTLAEDLKPILARGGRF
ncbi:SCO family protein [Marinithermus hydrothermalis]|uniref:Electron transport protein SCO1/SenC n=1 Tax=Marinithermus hydrothermalis (strain DSM 14884 / JCM 11576 / T1) TaxID=869210 RepID=F2NLB4_MARHT|nr:SCO family protein [Marinithermus hydrothermalis]AEB11733.1 electron transport protein SCO1/SenC [Marinithermus hydrothermalis DSM 14884]